MLAGVSLIRNGNKLNYPFVPCIKNLLSCCDVVVCSVATNNDDDTLEIMEKLAEDHLGKLCLERTKWDLSETMAEDLGHRIDIAIERARILGADSVLFVQADEIVHPDRIKELVSFVPPQKNNIYLQRSYLWKDLTHINTAWTLTLLRMCPITPTLRCVEGGMTLKDDNGLRDIYIPADIARIFHYSRIGNTKKIADRINSLRKLFDSSVEEIDDYVFGGKKEFESEVFDNEVIEVELEHPPYVEDFYK